MASRASSRDPVLALEFARRRQAGRLGTDRWTDAFGVMTKPRRENAMISFKRLAPIVIAIGVASPALAQLGSARPVASQ